MHCIFLYRLEVSISLCEMWLLKYYEKIELLHWTFTKCTLCSGTSIIVHEWFLHECTGLLRFCTGVLARVLLRTSIPRVYWIFLARAFFSDFVQPHFGLNSTLRFSHQQHRLTHQLFNQNSTKKNARNSVRRLSWQHISTDSQYGNGRYARVGLFYIIRR